MTRADNDAENKMESAARVSVINPVYNVEKYLAKCLDSVINQTLQDIEIICVDDGSKDGSPEILSQYAAKDARIKVITQTNRGLSSARNAGMEIAKCEYFGFVDSDDWIEPETYALALSKMLEDSEVDLVCWGANVISEEGENEDFAQKHYGSGKTRGKIELNDDICLQIPCNVWNKLFKREIIAGNHVVFPEGFLFEDLSFFWCYIANCRYGYFLQGNYYNYLRRKDSIMGLAYQKKYHRHFELLNWEVIFHYYKRKQIFEKKRDLLEVLFLTRYRTEINQSPQPEKVLEHAEELNKKYGLNLKLRYSFLEKVFSVKNSHSRSHKVICILGVKFSLRRARP